MRSPIVDGEPCTLKWRPTCEGHGSARVPLDLGVTEQERAGGLGGGSPPADRGGERKVEGEPVRKLKKYLLGRREELWTWIETGGMTQSNSAAHGLRFHIAGKREVSGGSRSEDGAARPAVLASIQATAKMRGIHFREVGERLLHGDSDALRMRKGTPEPPVP